MNPKRIALAVVLSLAIAFVVSYAFYARIRMQQGKNNNVVKVVAATKALSAGSPISADSIALIDWPASSPLSGAFSHPEDLIGRAVIYPIEEHQPILDHDVAAAGSGIGLTVKIPEGMRAVSVRSNDVVGVAGFLYPGSHVDVLVTSKVGNSPRTRRLKPFFPTSRCLPPDRRSSLIRAENPRRSMSSLCYLSLKTAKNWFSLLRRGPSSLFFATVLTRTVLIPGL